MRRLAVGVTILALLMVPISPPAASAGGCHIDLSNPTSPGYSEDCKDPEEWIDDLTLRMNASSEQASSPASGLVDVCGVEADACQVNAGWNVTVRLADGTVSTNAQALTAEELASCDPASLCQAMLDTRIHGDAGEERLRIAATLVTDETMEIEHEISQEGLVED